MIEKSLGQLERKVDSIVPWREIWTSVPFLVLLIAQVRSLSIFFNRNEMKNILQIGHDWGFYMTGLNLPKYLNNVLNLSIQTSGLITSASYLSMWIFSLIVGFLSDWLINSGYMKITNVRKIFAALCTQEASFWKAFDKL